MGWDVNVHVKSQKQLMLRTRGVGWGGMGWDVNVRVKLQWMPAWLKANGITGQKTELVSHVSDADDADDADDDDDDEC